MTWVPKVWISDFFEITDPDLEERFGARILTWCAPKSSSKSESGFSSLLRLTGPYTVPMGLPDAE